MKKTFECIFKFPPCSLNRSDVFMAMLGDSAARAGMKEAEEREIRLDDIRLRTLKKFVQYLYTDSCDGLPASAADLLVAAEKYNVPALKLECEEALVAAIRVR